MSDCKSIIPDACGKWHMKMPDSPCGQLYFTGLTDITVTQGESVDLDTDVHAYDANGAEIEFTHTSVDTDDCGMFYVAYTAQGVGNKILPHLCFAKKMLHLTDCGTNRITARRKVIVEPSSELCVATVCCATIYCPPK